MSYSIKLVTRDYWQIDYLERSLQHSLQLSGRRRTTESYWDPLELPIEHLQRFTETIGDALAVINGFSGKSLSAEPTLFPAFETLAACRGVCYWIEVIETTIHPPRSSSALVVNALQDLPRPVLYLQDDEVGLFHQDLMKLHELTVTFMEDGCLPRHLLDSASTAFRESVELVRA